MSSQKKNNNTDDSGNQMHPTVMHIQECSTQIQNALETMLDFVIASPRSSVEGRGEYACGVPFGLKRYARQRYIVYRGHHPFVPAKTCIMQTNTYNPQNLCLIISSRERAKITVPIERDCDDVDKATTIRSSGPPLWVF